MIFVIQTQYFRRGLDFSYTIAAGSRALVIGRAVRPPREGDARVDQSQALLRALRSQSTRRLLGLGVITLGVYFGHFIRGRTAILNRHLPLDRGIPGILVWTVLLLGYLNLLSFLADFIFAFSGPIQVASGLADLAWGASVIGWGFAARSRVHCLLSAQHGDDCWFNPLATFFLTPIYFNYKVNVLVDLSTDAATNVCPECGLRYDPSNYRSDAVRWLCTRCSAEIPKPEAAGPDS